MSLKQERISLGLCYICGNPNTSGKYACDDCRKHANELSRIRRNKLKEQGLCVVCGKSIDGKAVRCETCRVSFNQYVADSQKLKRSLGICIICGEERDRSSDRFCTYHKMEKRLHSQAEYERIKNSDNYSDYRKKQSDYQRKRFDDRHENGVCVKCGKRKIHSPHSNYLCSICRAKYNSWQREHRAADESVMHRNEIIKGVHCMTCLKPVETQGETQCNRCRKVSLLNLEKSRDNHPWKRSFK